jgi:hypothetical protein
MLLTKIDDLIETQIAQRPRLHTQLQFSGARGHRDHTSHQNRKTSPKKQFHKFGFNAAIEDNSALASMLIVEGTGADASEV